MITDPQIQNLGLLVSADESPEAIRGIVDSDFAVMIWNPSSNVSNHVWEAEVIWVYDGQLQTATATNPSSPFPFTRLAWATTPQTAQRLYVYHQLNGDTIVEEAYVDNIGWQSTNITITT